MKACRKCGDTKPLTEFYKKCKSRSHIGDGHQAQCKECVKAHHRTDDARALARAAAKKLLSSSPEVRERRRAACSRANSTPAAKARQKERARQWRIDNPERGAEISRRSCRNYGRTEKGRAARRAWLDRNPQKRAAYAAFKSALVAGRLIRPDRCEKCTTACKPHGHHHDYSKPLDVEWLCHACHVAEHHP